MADKRFAARMSIDLRAELEDSRSRLLEAIRGFTEERFRARPEPDAWSVSEIMAHLMFWEQRMRDGIRRALGRPGPFPSAPSEAEQEAEVGRQAPVPQIVHGLLAVRREIRLLVESLQPGDLPRPATHPELGTVTVERMFRRIAEHETEHCRQIEAIRQVLRTGTVRTP